MGNRRVITILLSAILVCALLLWFVQRRERYFPESSRARNNLVEGPLDHVTRITIDHGVARIGLVQHDGIWELTAPFVARVDQGAVARLLDGFESVRVSDALSVQEIRRRELSLRDFGLTPPRTHVEWEGPQGRAHYLFGSFTPIGTDVYVQLEGDDQILTVPAELYKTLPRTADDVRSRRLAHGNRAMAQTVELRMPGSPFIKLSRDSGTWRLTQPMPAPAADERVEALLDLLFDEHVDQFVWPTVSNVMDVAESDAAFKTRLELYGLGAESGLQVQVETHDGKAPERIVFGRRVEGMEGLSYVLLSGGSAIGTVSNRIAEACRIKPSEIRDPRIFSEVQGVVRQIQIYFGDTRYAFSQTNGVWRIESPVVDIADQQAIGRTLDQLLRLETVEPIKDESDAVTPAEEDEPTTLCHVVLLSGLNTETRFVVQQQNSDKETFQLMFTNSLAASSVASSNMPLPLISEAGVLSLRDKTILSLPEASVRRVTRRFADGAQERLVREKNATVWHSDVENPKLPVQDNLKNLLKLLSGLQTTRVEQLGVLPGDADRYGLSQPWLEISVDVDVADTVRKTIVIGNSAGMAGRFAAVRGLDVVFVLGEDAVKTLSAQLLEPR